jgi:hypothetical protein
MHVLKRTLGIVPLLALAAIVLGLPATAFSRDEGREFTARLFGANEVPPINTAGSATLKLDLRSDRIDFELKYQNLTGAPAAAHIHFGQARVNGGVMAFFCGGGNQPACPSTASGTISGSITSANVVAIPNQGIDAGDLATVEREIRAGLAYANMHTARFGSGEIRGQIRRD